MCRAKLNIKYGLSSFSMVLAVVLCLDPSSTMAQPCERYEAATEVGEFSSPDVNESSGIVISSAYPDIIWTHNDSGGSAIVYGATLSGADQGSILLTDISARDWEDMSAGPCGSTHCLFVGDIGDNGVSRNNVTLHRFEELDVPGPGQTTSVTPKSLTLTYEEGAMDSEALAVDPKTGDAFIFEKSKGDTFDVRIYRVPAEVWSDQHESLSLSVFQTLDLSGYGIQGSAPPYAPPYGAHITAGDFSPDGSEVMLKTYEEGIRLNVITNPDGGVAHFEFQEAISVWRNGQCESIAYHPLDNNLWYSCEGRGLIAKSLCVAATDETDSNESDTSDVDSENENTNSSDTDLSGDTTQDSEGGCQQTHPGGLMALLSLLLLPFTRKT